MGELIESLTRGNVAEVKTVLASVALALGIYQVILMAVGYGKVRPPFLSGAAASRAHRAVGDGIVVLVVLVAIACLSLYGFGDAVDEGGALVAHAVAGTAVLVLLAVKIGIVRRWGRFGSLLPYVGTAILAALVVAWATTAPDVFGGEG